MFNMFLHEKRQKLAEDHAFQTRFEQKPTGPRYQYREHLNKKFEKRLDKFIDYTIVNPMEPVNTFVLNESFLKHKTNHGYKTHLGGKEAPSFKTGFYQEKKDLNISCIEKADVTMLGPVIAKPFEFRKRDVEKEIQPLMRFANTRVQHRQNQNKSFANDEADYHKPASHERAIRYSSEMRKLKEISSGVRCSQSSCGSSVVSGEMPRREIPKKSEYSCGNWLPLKSVLTRAIDAYGEGRRRTPSRIQNQSMLDGDYSASDLDDSQLTGIDFLGRSKLPKPQYNAERALSVPKARAVLKNANLLKEKEF